MAYEEISDGDELAEWCRNRKKSGLNTRVTRDVQEKYGKVVDHVSRKHLLRYVKEFLNGADGWVIAHAMANPGTVVTRESFGGFGSTKIKIPNVCKELDVRWLDVFDMLDELDFKIP